MSYHYSSYSKTTTTTTTTSGGVSHTTKTSTTRHQSDSSPPSSVTVRELTANEVSNLSLTDSVSNYDVSDEDRLTKYDFYSLLDSQDESESESEVEEHWFPSLLQKSMIQFLDDKEQEDYMEEDTLDKKVQVIENEDEESSGSSRDSTAREMKIEDDDMHAKKEVEGGESHHKRHGKKHLERPRKTAAEQVPVEVIHLRF